MELRAAKPITLYGGLRCANPPYENLPSLAEAAVRVFGFAGPILGIHPEPNHPVEARNQPIRRSRPMSCLIGLK
jgi:hypothetical protein